MKVLFDTTNKRFEGWDELSLEQKDKLISALHTA